MCSSKRLISLNFVGQNGHNPFKIAILLYSSGLQYDLRRFRSPEIYNEKVRFSKKILKKSIKAYTIYHVCI